MSAHFARENRKAQVYFFEYKKVPSQACENFGLTKPKLFLGDSLWSQCDLSVFKTIVMTGVVWKISGIDRMTLYAILYIALLKLSKSLSLGKRVELTCWHELSGLQPFAELNKQYHYGLLAKSRIAVLTRLCLLSENYDFILYECVVWILAHPRMVSRSTSTGGNSCNEYLLEYQSCAVRHCVARCIGRYFL